MMFLSEFSPPAGSSEVRTVPGFPDTFSVGNPSNRDVVPGFPDSQESDLMLAFPGTSSSNFVKNLYNIVSGFPGI